MNLLINTGRLGKDARQFTTQNGTPGVAFNLAVEMGYGEQKTTEWRSCNFFGKRAAAIAQYLVKGQAVVVSGNPKLASYQDKEGATQFYIEINVSDIDLVGSAQGQSPRAPERTVTPSPRTSKPKPAVEPFNDDMPF